MNDLKSTRDVVRHTSGYMFGSVLDYGAGTAKYRAFVEPKVSTYTTFDMADSEAVDVVGDVLSPPFADVSFDTIISTQVLEHVEKPWVMVAQMRRLLRPGGVCVVTAPFMIPYHAHPYDFFRYTPEGLRSLFTNENFEILECDSYGKTFMVLSELIHFLWFNPYTDKKRNAWSLRIMRRIERIAGVLDQAVHNTIVYPNVYIVAKKKS